MIDNDRDISWKRLLRIQSNEKNGTYQNRRKMFFSLIKDPLFDQNDIADSLQKICDRDVAGITDWRKYFITVPEIMDSLHKYTDGRASERYVRFEGKYIFLMGSTRLYGWNEEYYSYALYCLLKKLPNASVKYNQAKGWEDVDCHIELTSSTNAGKWKIKYLRAKDKFSVMMHRVFKVCIQRLRMQSTLWKNFFSRLGTDIFFCYRENIILKTLKLPMSKGNE